MWQHDKNQPHKKIANLSLLGFDAVNIALVFGNKAMLGLSDLLFSRGPNLVQKRDKNEATLRQRTKKGPSIFSKFISSCKVI